MPRIAGARSLRLLSLAAAPQWPSTATPLVACCALSTTSPARGDRMSWVRDKLWKGAAPGPEDPYTQKPEAPEASNLPAEALEPRPRRDRTPAAIRASRLTLPPKRTEAATVKEAATDPDYVPATDGKGLEQIDRLETWWDQPGHWGKESEFKGFAPSPRITDSSIVEACMRRAVVEVAALQTTGHFEKWKAREWHLGGVKERRRTMEAKLYVTSGGLRLDMHAKMISSNVRGSVEPGKKGIKPLSKDEAALAAKEWGTTWKKSKLDDEVKFAVRKRLYQLTGNLIPDAKLAAASTVQHLLATAGAGEPKPPRLTAELRERGDLAKLPNVTVHGRRVGLITRETAIGRWKLIEEELGKRGLPARGAPAESGPKERDWLTSRA